MMKIMVVDDELVSRSKMKKILSAFGDCDTFDTGDLACRAFARALKEGDPYNLVTLDIAMPGKDGMEILMELRNLEGGGNDQKPPARILMVTSHADKDTIITCLQAGCDDYIIKPFNMDVIGEKLKKLGCDI